MFAITPHIIRGNTISELNQRQIEIGTANTIALRHVSHVAAPAAPTVQPQAPGSHDQPVNPTPNQAANPAAGDELPV